MSQKVVTANTLSNVSSFASSARTKQSVSPVLRISQILLVLLLRIDLDVNLAWILGFTLDSWNKIRLMMVDDCLSVFQLFVLQEKTKTIEISRFCQCINRQHQTIKLAIIIVIFYFSNRMLRYWCIQIIEQIYTFYGNCCLVDQLPFLYFELEVW